ncbi:MAG: DUF5320 domain-containing protein [Massilibacteroides sp.]|nr:DUF5320 domain-containing protein [Massilibacteroides sp.]MDD3062110.1 DUF5320 domain-containing protein [Massilibacteroides sp.]MDD4115654.1 DUF5320 domain-containing protein [Massilibacteroides sp.]MDD4659654.1 DUF5320 domain-containing protein [Massilibacteroides sp.]
MPGLNRKGPNGDGAMTGRKMGRCNPDNKGKTDNEIIQNRMTFPSENQEMKYGQGRGRGRGFGRGFGAQDRK